MKRDETEAFILKDVSSPFWHKGEPMYLDRLNHMNPTHRTKMEILLGEEGIRLDQNLDYSCGIYNEQDTLVATASLFQNTIRCVAVKKEAQGEGLVNRLVSHLIQVALERGSDHLFIYTKPHYAVQFESLGFYRIAEVANQIVFLENKKEGFRTYLDQLIKESPSPLPNRQVAGIVMNANPFTKGHLSLVQEAANENEWVHLFVVSEDQSDFPFSVRKKLIEKGIEHLRNVIIHETGPYLVSSATFPAYFQPDQDSVINSQVQLESKIFLQIAHALNIKRRYVGTEPTSRVTSLYNQGMAEAFENIELLVVNRMELDGQSISASKVRKAIKEDDWESIARWVPETTLDYLKSDQAKEILDQIRLKEQVEHY